MSIPAGGPWRALPGFPVCYESGAGTFTQGAQHGIVIGSVDADPDLEILLSSVAGSTHDALRIFKNTGRPLTGWPPAGFPKGTAPLVLARLTGGTPDGIYAGTHTVGQTYLTAALTDSGVLSGWPRDAANYVGTAPSAHDIDGDGHDELFAGEEDFRLHAYRSTGAVLAGWPQRPQCGSAGGQRLVSMAFGDLNNDGRTDVVAASFNPFGGVNACLVAFNADGTSLPGFPVSVRATDRDPLITLGDVDDDGALEIVYVLDHPRPDNFTDPPVVLVISGSGTLERTIPLQGQILYSASASVLADLDEDGTPEIVVLAEGTLNVVRGDGSAVPGFPATFSEHTTGGAVPQLMSCGAVVGDIDGDSRPDIVFCARAVAGSQPGAQLWAFDRRGVRLQGSPLVIAETSFPRGPAIADIDLDGQNEIVVGTHQSVWALRYGNVMRSGPVQWGQYGRDSRHTNRYP